MNTPTRIAYSVTAQSTGGRAGRATTADPELALDLRARRVTLGQRPVVLTAREFDLLAFFLRHPGRAVTRETLLAEVWGEDEDHTLNVVDVYVSYLRRKLGGSGAELRTVRGYGYILGEMA